MNPKQKLSDESEPSEALRAWVQGRPCLHVKEPTHTRCKQPYKPYVINPKPKVNELSLTSDRAKNQAFASKKASTCLSHRLEEYGSSHFLDNNWRFGFWTPRILLKRLRAHTTRRPILHGTGYQLYTETSKSL